ncbi:MAG: Hsp70 family protein, partial [Candidatus Binatia bacterium]
TASSGLGEEEIKRMVKDAETHASEDKKRKEVVEARNQLDSLIYSTEKSLKEYSGEIEAGVKENIEGVLEKAKKAMESEDVQTIRSAVDELSRSSHKLAEAMYAKASQQQSSTQQQSSADQQGQTTDGEGKKKEDVVDADFEEVKD